MEPMEKPEEKVIARILPGRSVRIETEKFVIHKEPRISAAKLGEYLVTGSTKQKTILKNQKKAPKVIILRHKQTKVAFVRSFTGSGFDGDFLLKRSDELKSVTEFSSEWDKENTANSALALKLLSETVGGIKLKESQRITRPGSGWGSLNVNGVQISVEPSIVFSFQQKGVTKIGSVLLYLTKDPSKTLAKSLEGNTAGNYAAVILLRLLSEKMSAIGTPSPKDCYVIDVARKEIHTPPKSFQTLLNNVEEGCETIRLRWDGIEV